MKFSYLERILRILLSKLVQSTCVNIVNVVVLFFLWPVFLYLELTLGQKPFRNIYFIYYCLSFAADNTLLMPFSVSDCSVFREIVNLMQRHGLLPLKQPYRLDLVIER